MECINISSFKIAIFSFFVIIFAYTASYAQTTENTGIILKSNAEIIDGAGETAGPLIDDAPVKRQEDAIYKVRNPENPCDRSLDTYAYSKSWYDETQAYVNSKFCEPALYFDNFFASDRIFEEGVAGTYIRWRNDFSFDEEEYFKLQMNINASFELPDVQRRMRLTLENDEDQDLRNIAPGTGQSNATSLGVQLDLLENVRSKINVSVSLKPRIRLRYRYTYPVVATLILRLTQTVQREQQIHSGRTLIDVEKLINESFLFRSTTEGELSEKFDGVDWVQAFVLFQRLNKKASISYETSANGITQPLTLVTSYRAGVRFRKNFHRKWLFYEIAPEVTWPVSLSGSRQEVLINRRSRWLILFRFEVHFGNAYKKRYQDYN